MRIIGVIDLLGNRAVHARAGDRARYQPVVSVAGSSIDPGDAVALAGVYINRLGLDALYAADLDAILGTTIADHGDAGEKNPQSPHARLVRRLAGLGVPLWLDAGISTIDRAQRGIELGAAHLIVGLETLSSYAALDAICAGIGGPRVALSLDLKQGEPVRSPDGNRRPETIAARAAAAGAAAVIVLDLARVGTGSGPDLATIARIRQAVPDTTLLAGGGVRGYDDLRRLAESGCDGALVATALHDGRLTAAHIAAAIELSVRRA